MDEPAVDAILYGACVTFFACAVVKDERVREFARYRFFPSALLIVSVFTLGTRSDVWASDAGIALAAMCGLIAAGSLLVSTYREQVVTRRLVKRLRDGGKRDAVLAELRARVKRAEAQGDGIVFEEALRQALEPLIIAGCWTEVAWLALFAQQARTRYRSGFGRWLKGVHALAELHGGDASAASDALKGVAIEGPWLCSIEALRLALGGEGKAALAMIDDLPEKVEGAVGHQRRLAEVHALAGLGRRAEARERLDRMRIDGMLEAALEPVGPASGMAADMLAGAAGPFRASA